MKITWPEPFPGIHWLDREEEEAVLAEVRGGALFRYYGQNSLFFLAIEPMNPGKRFGPGDRHCVAP